MNIENSQVLSQGFREAAAPGRIEHWLGFPSWKRGRSTCFLGGTGTGAELFPEICGTHCQQRHQAQGEGAIEDLTRSCENTRCGRKL